ncbi:metalloenzyme superfamily protein [Acinetobacter baumannii 25493_5]|nr:metalloenzyme superfamily protein [Acinetobacter baumannii 25493_5]
MTDATAGKIPHVLVIMDGVGHREAIEDNAFLAAKTPNLTAMKAKHPNSLISGSGEDVGLPDGQMGNSEVGHMNLGAGRVLYKTSHVLLKIFVLVLFLSTKYWLMP